MDPAVVGKLHPNIVSDDELHSEELSQQKTESM